MERILMFLGLFIAGIIIGLGFCVGSLYIYNLFKIGYYEQGIAVIFYLSVVFVLLMYGLGGVYYGICISAFGCIR